jgi:hypothetical protein
MIEVGRTYFASGRHAQMVLVPSSNCQEKAKHRVGCVVRDNGMRVPEWR